MENILTQTPKQISQNLRVWHMITIVTNKHDTKKLCTYFELCVNSTLQFSSIYFVATELIHMFNYSFLNTIRQYTHKVN